MASRGGYVQTGEPLPEAEIRGAQAFFSGLVAVSMTARLLVAGIALGLVAVGGADAQVLYEGEAFTITDTSVVQDSVRVQAPSRTKIVSIGRREAAVINFTFALLHSDGEQHRGVQRRLRLGASGATLWTPVYVFGTDEPATATRSTIRVAGDSVAVTFRVDLRPVLRELRTNGRYAPPTGPSISEGTFEGVAVFGSTPPLGRRSETDGVRLTDPDDDGVYRTTVVFDRSVVRSRSNGGKTIWAQSEDPAEKPSYTSDQRLVDALYNRAMDKVLQHRQPDSSSQTGARQESARTQRVSSRTLLSLALVDPQGAKRRLMRQIENGRIRSDPGLGGGWPVSTGRMAWALAAWEVFKTTGDTTWLQRSYDVIRRSANADLRTVVDEQTGLFFGASLFAGAAEHFYPTWMQPADVARASTLRTSVVQYRTYRILTQMAKILGTFPGQWARVAHRLKQGINEHLWQPQAGRYAAYRYGRVYEAPVSRTDAMGHALVVLSGVTGAQRARRVVQNQPVVDVGVPTLWPVSSDTPVNNRLIVNAYWAWASAAAQNTPGVEHGLASLYRGAALASAETSQNASSHGIGQAAGLLATVYRVLFGMRVTTKGLTLAPFVPAAYSGTHTLEEVSYRDATLNITMKGHGTRIVQTTLDGTPLQRPVIPPDLTGSHEVRLLLSGGVPDGDVNRVASKTAPATPSVRRVDDGIAWAPVETAASYHVFHNGTVVDTTADLHHAVAAGSTLTEVQVQAVGASERSSFRSEPVRVIADTAVRIVQPGEALSTTHENYTGGGYRRLAPGVPDSVTVSVPEAGMYALDFRYANGHGRVQAGRTCAIRSIEVDGERVGTAVLPARGVWADWGYSPALRLSLKAGTHTVVLASDKAREGRHTVHLDHLRITPLATDGPIDSR